MAFTYTYGANMPLDAIRMLIADTDSTKPVFDDREITMAAQIDSVSFFASTSFSFGVTASTVGSPSIRRTAAVLLDALAANKARLSAALEVLDIKLNPDRAAAALQKQAQYLREVEAESGTFAIAEMVLNPQTYRERVWKEWFRRFEG